MTDTSWREEYLTMKSGLNETQIRLLKEGAWSLSSSLITYYKKNIHLLWKTIKQSRFLLVLAS